MIRPVQRLPSVILLLRELLKVTKSGNPDVAWLRCALETLDYVLSQSNERRQQSDQHSRILDVANNIDDFPVCGRASAFAMANNRTMLECRSSKFHVHLIKRYSFYNLSVIVV